MAILMGVAILQAYFHALEELIQVLHNSMEVLALESIIAGLPYYRKSNLLKISLLLRSVAKQPFR